uniref:SAM-dependent MTase RsmB/NOP-type domain-containing protein n=1 Tax=Trypanosoma congolense (strain IL3000) TaxID=1068625 RepID=G0UWP2_TRYCI|nr:conserved hypothetical protein [Trypanosoma congolense IL3000]
MVLSSSSLFLKLTFFLLLNMAFNNLLLCYCSLLFGFILLLFSLASLGIVPGRSFSSMQPGQVSEIPKRKKLKSFGKNRRELKTRTVYDEEGNWVAVNHQDSLRQMPCPALDRYYRDLQTLLPPSEWDAEMALFREPLPTTIWINDTDPMACGVARYFESLPGELVEPIPWYPIPGMAWRIKAGKAEFRRRPEMQELRKFLILQTALGTVSRQEEVSMIPPFLLDIQPTDKCLDMCASPGSKTAQILVALGRHKVVARRTDSSPFPFDYDSEGLVVANDIDTKRANMLVHQVKRMRLLFPFALFTNHDAQFFPNVQLGAKAPSICGGEQSTLGDNGAKELRFDKILCDVVCSGDGTIRKAPHIMKIWSPREAISLQKTQIQIALRACHLLRVGGRLVYSTCSMNPIENEAVVAQIVHRTRGAMKLIDCSGLLPGLQYTHGLEKWVVTNAKGDVVTAPSGEAHEALFPPRTPGAYSSEAVDKLNLRLCMRLFPSHCKGGAFFIAVMDKVSEFRFQRQEEVPQALPVGREGKSANDKTDKPHAECLSREQQEKVKEDDAPEARRGEARKKGVPPQFVAAPEPIIDTINNFYSVNNFPTHLLVVRTANGQRELKLSVGSVCSIVSRSALEVLQFKTDALIVVSAGLRVFAHENLDGGWRIASEAATLFATLMLHSPRRLRVHVNVVKLLLSGGKLKDVPFDNIEDESLRAQLLAMDVGTVLLEVDSPCAVGGVFYTVALRARKRLQLLVDHEDVVGLRMRLGLPATDDLSEV